MTTLDHSSPASLLADINRYRGCVFRYDLKGGRRGPPWRLVWARTACDDNLFICNKTTGGIEESSEWQLRDGYLQLARLGAGLPCLDWQVVIDGSQGGGGCPSVDDSQRDRLDKNLRGVFS